MRFTHLLLITLLALSKAAYAKDIHIGIEPFPPIITEDGTGYAIDMFKAIEVISDLKFHFHIMNYARAKKELKNNNLDLIGLTPKGYETADFYGYAEDIDWGVSAKVDLFTLNTKHFNIDSLPEQSIGTLRGNADFFSELLNIPRNKFIEVSSLPQLIQMLALKRLDVITFERASTMTTLEKFKVRDVFYQNVAKIPASFAVRNNKAGKELKATLDKYLTQIKSNYYFTAYFHYQKMKDAGKVSIPDDE